VAVQGYWDANDTGSNQCDPNAPTGRYKIVNNTCVWVSTDSGPNQCSPNVPLGRYKIVNNTCVWVSTESGPNQCSPSVPLGRYKIVNNTCVWVSTESGPNQCSPSVPLGRYRIVDNTCVWVSTDSGPNQCNPDVPLGRYKVSTGDSCVWASTESGPNQCDPQQPPATEPPPVTDGAQVPEVTEEGSLSDAGEQNYTEMLSAGDILLPSCRAYTRKGNAGYISVQTNPLTGYLQWGAYMWIGLHNYGLWNALVTVNGVIVDQKTQAYPPHASLPPSKAPPGSIFSTYVGHLYFRWFVAPVWIPDYGWRFDGRWQLAYASGSLSCIVPFSEQ
jgi:hypothetical protein